MLRGSKVAVLIPKLSKNPFVIRCTPVFSTLNLYQSPEASTELETGIFNPLGAVFGKYL